MNISSNSNQIVKVWDLPTRLFHWALVIGVVVSFVSIKMDEMELHITSAMCIMGLLVFRLIWGFVGSRTARFSQFIPSPGRLINYLCKKETADDHFGHSPLGALSVIALLLFMSLQLLTGLVADDDIYTTGPLREWVSSDVSAWATGQHVLLADILQALVALHIAAILFYWVFKKNNLIKPMISGYKNLGEKIAKETDVTYKLKLAVFVIFIAAVLAYGVFNHL